MSTLPSGARFFRCALQVNPRHYSGKYQGRPLFGDSAEAYVDAVLRVAAEEGIEVLGITDHHDVASVDEFARRAEPLGITVLPGFEASSSEGAHVLCLFDPKTPRDELNRALGSIGFAGDTTCSLPFFDLVEKIDALGGVTIAAHVHDGDGLLLKLSGRPRVKAWTSPYLHAAAIKCAPKDLNDQGLRAILLNKDDAHRRSRLPALIYANDVKSPDDLRNPRTRTLLKMSRPTAEGLRQAFLDPDSRVRWDEGALSPHWPRLRRIQWSGGFLDGVDIRFNDNLNVLIGGRGTGKSAIVESLRYAFELDAHPDVQRRNAEFVRQVLGGGTSVRVEVEIGEPARRYVIERTVPDPPRVLDTSGAVRVGVRPRDVFQLTLLGQGELAIVAEDEVRRTSLLSRFVERDPGSERKKAELRRRLERSRQQILELVRDLDHDREAAAKLVTVRERLKRFEGLELEAKLHDRTLLGRERQLFDGATERVTAVRELVDALGGQLPVDTTFLSPRAIADLPGRAHLEEVAATLDRMSERLREGVDALAATLAAADRDIASSRTAWSARERGVDEAYKKLLREMQSQGVRSGTDFVELKDQLHALEPAEARVKAREEQLQKATEARANLLAEWEAQVQDEYQRLVRAAKRVEKLERVRVSVTFRGDREPLWALLRRETRHLSTDRLEALTPDRLSPRQLADAIRGGVDALTADPFRLTRAQAEKLHACGEALAMQVEELELPPTTQISFDTGPDGSPHWQTIEQLSKGQRASAVLMILLLAGPGEATPLVIDQPEDDLDNRFVTEGIVPQLKRAKQERQFVFSTHNANLPVLGDAELIVTLETRVRPGTRDVVGHVDPARVGSIDLDEVRHSVEEILEGGKDAFELRRQKYHF